MTELYRTGADKSRIPGHQLMCDCCGNQVMAMDYPDRMEIRSKGHGSWHTKVVFKDGMDITVDTSYRDKLRDMVISSTN